MNLVRAHNRGGTESGVAAVEFGIVSLLLFLVLFGIIEFGQFLGEKQALEAAAREGARLASVRADSTEVTTRVRDAADPYTIDDASGISVSVESGGGQCDDSNSGDKVTVSWEEEFDISLPFVPVIDADVPISGVFRCE